LSGPIHRAYIANLFLNMKKKKNIHQTPSCKNMK
jgi:hypothetical protein